MRRRRIARYAKNDPDQTREEKNVTRRRAEYFPCVERDDQRPELFGKRKIVTRRNAESLARILIPIINVRLAEPRERTGFRHRHSAIRSGDGHDNLIPLRVGRQFLLFLKDRVKRRRFVENFLASKRGVHHKRGGDPLAAPKHRPSFPKSAFAASMKTAPQSIEIGDKKESDGVAEVGQGSRSRAPLGVIDGRGIMFAGHNGELYPAGFLPICCGRFPQDSVVDVYQNSPVFTALRNPELFKGRCGKCKFRTVCGGSRSRAYVLTGDFLAEEPDCDFPV